MFVNCKQSSYYATFLIYKKLLFFQFYPNDLVNTKTTIPLSGSVSSTRYTAISRKVVGKNVHTTIPKGNMGYDQYTVPDTVAVEPTFVAFL